MPWVDGGSPCCIGRCNDEDGAVFQVRNFCLHFFGSRQEDWPDATLDASLNPDGQEVWREVTTNAVNVCGSVEPTDQLIRHFSDRRKLKSLATWFLCLKAVLLKKADWRRWLKKPIMEYANHYKYPLCLGFKKKMAKTRRKNSILSGCKVLLSEKKQSVWWIK